MFKIRQKNKLSVKVKGWFISPIQYEDCLGSGKWSDYFGHYQNQRWGEWDSNSCWCLSAVNCAEDQLEWLWKNGMFSQEAKNFFTKNGYIDSDGDFSLSERYLEVLGNNLDNGGTADEAWQLIQKYGCIPRMLLNYSLEQAQQHSSKQSFNVDYFSPSNVTYGMRIMGQEFLKHVNICYQSIGKKWTTPQRMVFEAALKQAPLQIGIPVPRDVSYWNKEFVGYDGKVAADHEVELYAINADGSYAIFDQYMPNLKTLSSDYYIPLVTQGILTAVTPITVNPIKQDSYWQKFWTSVFNFFNGIKPTVPIGSS